MAKLFRAAIMGPPGSGKGTISKRIAQSFGLQYLSSGHFLRESIAANAGRRNVLTNSCGVNRKKQPAGKELHRQTRHCLSHMREFLMCCSS